MLVIQIWLNIGTFNPISDHQTTTKFCICNGSAGDESKTKFPSKFELRWENREWNGPQVKVAPSTITNQTWWHQQMETFFALLALCTRNLLVTGEFSIPKPVTRSFDVFIDLLLNKRLSEQSRRPWFQTPLRLSWHYCNAQSYWRNIRWLLFTSTRAIPCEKNWVYRSVFLNFNSFCFSHDFMSLPVMIFHPLTMISCYTTLTS